jgi:hypothetical protein
MTWLLMGALVWVALAVAIALALARAIRMADALEGRTGVPRAGSDGNPLRRWRVSRRGTTVERTPAGGRSVPPRSSCRPLWPFHVHLYRRTSEDPFSGHNLYACRCGRVRHGF